MSIERQLKIDFLGQEKKPEPEADGDLKEKEVATPEVEDLKEEEVTALAVERITKSINRPAPRKIIRKNEEPVPTPKPENISPSREIEYPDPYSEIYPLSRYFKRPRK